MYTEKVIKTSSFEVNPLLIRVSVWFLTLLSYENISIFYYNLLNQGLSITSQKF